VNHNQDAEIIIAAHVAYSHRTVGGDKPMQVRNVTGPEATKDSGGWTPLDCSPPYQPLFLEGFLGRLPFTSTPLASSRSSVWKESSSR
jgi:hypothetical protein